MPDVACDSIIATAVDAVNRYSKLAHVQESAVLPGKYGIVGVTYFICVVHLATNSLCKLVAYKVAPSLVGRIWLNKRHVFTKHCPACASHGVVQMHRWHTSPGSRQGAEAGYWAGLLLPEAGCLLCFCLQRVNAELVVPVLLPTKDRGKTSDHLPCMHFVAVTKRFKLTKLVSKACCADWREARSKFSRAETKVRAILAHSISTIYIKAGQVRRGLSNALILHKGVRTLTPMTKNSTCVPGGLFVTHSRNARLIAAARNGQASPQSQQSHS